MRARWLPLLLCYAALTARALVVDGGMGTANTSDPGNGLPWGNVGSVNGSSGIYLGTFGGSYWAITAAHVGAGNLTLGSTTYQAVANSSVRVLNSDNSNSDLVLFRLSSDPGLAALTLSSSAPADESGIKLVGYGQVEGALNYWTRTVVEGTNNDTWIARGTSEAGANISGFLLSSSIGKRWGDNRIEGAASYDVGTGMTESLYTIFSGLDAQGATGDSGGAAFYHDGTRWLLAGVMGAVGRLENQPTGTAMAGNATYLASMAAYSEFITAAIPEPSTWSLILGAVAGACVWFIRRCN